jgi:hypothetical protein
MAKKRFVKGLERRQANRSARIRIIIVCEGSNTEPRYFEDFARHYANRLVKLELIAGAGVPMTLVNRAIEAKTRLPRKSSFEKGDTVWAVFDRDDHPLVDEARAKAAASGVGVAYSNPCFEVWPMLHFGPFDAPDGRHQVQNKLAAKDPSYDSDSSKVVDFALIVDQLDNAIARAEQMRARRIEEDDEFGAPYTDVDVLAALIRSNGNTQD